MGDRSAASSVTAPSASIENNRDSRESTAFRARSCDKGSMWVHSRSVNPGSPCPRYCANSLTTALRRHLGVDDDPGSRHVFVFDSQKIPRFSDNALRKMRQAQETLDMAQIWEHHRPVGDAKVLPQCPIQGCAST